MKKEEKQKPVEQEKPKPVEQWTTQRLIAELNKQYQMLIQARDNINVINQILSKRKEPNG